MKIRTGFVSNSSSSSFVIGKNFMSPKLIKAFRRVINQSEEMEYDYDYINEDNNYFFGTLDNCNVEVIEFLNNTDLIKYTGFGE